MEPESSDLQYVTVHGYRRAYRKLGSGPVLLLLHGLACDSSTWTKVIEPLAERFTVIAPDLLGHGASDKPDADYSLGGYANGMRDLLTLLGIDKVTVVGHSFGGGVAMQFAYQYPDRIDRVVLVSTGGLGRDVTPLIRLLTIPGMGVPLALSTIKPLRKPVATSMRLLSKSGLHELHDLNEVADIYESFSDKSALRAVRRVTGHVVNWRGQFITMTDRTYLASIMPVLVIWGDRDQVIPSSHAEIARAQAMSNVQIMKGCGHFPHKDRPQEFIDKVVQFVDQTDPAVYHRGRWRAMLKRGNTLALAKQTPDHRNVDVAG